MNLYLDTSTPACVLRLNDKEYRWESGRNLAEGLHKFILKKMQENGWTWKDIEKITYFSGPGSFTGLRIGAAVVNSLAHELKVPLFDHHGNEVKIILPDYGRPARITPQKK